MSVMMFETHEKIVKKIRRRSRIIYGLLILFLLFSFLSQAIGSIGNDLARESYRIVRERLIDYQNKRLLLELLRNKPLTVSQALEIADVVIEESKSKKVPVSLIQGIMSLESEFNPNAISSKGARGLMQIMPAVWKAYLSSPDLHGKISRHNPALNVRVGVRYLGDLWKQHRNWEKVLKEYGGFVKEDPRPYIRIVMSNAEKFKAQLGE